MGVHDDTADTGLLYMRQRHYEPTLARFLSRDPLGYEGGDSLYAYGGNNPIVRFDPAGEAWDTVTDVLGLGVDVGMIILNPLDPSGYAQLGVDILLTGTPGVPNTGSIKGAKAIKEGGEIVMTQRKIRGLMKVEALNRARQLSSSGTIMSYKRLRELVEGNGNLFQVHHILEKRFAGQWRCKNIDPDLIPSVVLGKREHELITKRLNRLLPTMKGRVPQTYTPEQVWDAYETAYAAYPTWLNAIRPYFK